MSASDAGGRSADAFGVGAEAEFIERLFRRRDLEQASTLQTQFAAATIGEGGRELTELMAAARENVALIAGVTAQSAPRRSAS